MNNVFQIGGEVSGKSFISREKLVGSIRKRFIENKLRNAASIVGITRTGKTSLVKKVFENVPDDIIYIYEDLKEWETYFELWQDICLKIEEDLNDKGYINTEILERIQSMEDANLPWVKMVRNIKKIFECLSDMKLKTVLVLDEFDNATSLFESKTKYYELFRTIFSDGSFNVSAITISRRSLHTIEGTTYQSSTFHGVLDTLFFKGFDSIDMKEYFDVFVDDGIQLSETDKQKIIYYAGNSPYLLSILGHYIVDTFQMGEDIDIEKIFFGKCKQINDYYRDCLKHLKVDGDLSRILPFVIGPNIGVTQNDKDELFNLGYFREEGDNLIVISEYFRSFLSASAVQISIWDNIIHLERRIKQLIERELARLVRKYSAFGNSEEEILRNILRGVEGISNGDILRYDGFISNNKRDFNSKSTYLDVMSLKDSVKIIEDCWVDIFSPYFNNELYSEWGFKFNKCAMARNPIAHGHEDYLSHTDKREIDVYCNQIINMIENTIGKIQTESTSFLEVAKEMGEETQYIEYEMPCSSLVGCSKEMKILEIGQNNLRGVVENKYRAIIPKNYLVGKKLEDFINQNLIVEIENISGEYYRVKLK